MKYIDAFLNRMTMYRLLIYGLGIITFIAIFASTLHLVHFEPKYMVLSLGVLAASVFVTEYLLSIVFDRPMNQESWIITTLILFLITPPAVNVLSVLALALAGGLASLSKFILAWRGKHIFNPAAFAAAVLSLTALWPASWWVGSSTLWVFCLIFGLLVIRKIRHVSMVVWFVIVSIVIQIVQFALNKQLIWHNVQQALIASPLIFLSTIMLTEPATMPARRVQQYIFATIAAFFASTSFSIGTFYIYPEVALLIANLYAFIVSPKFSVSMQLKSVQEIGTNVANFIFVPMRRFTFVPGQYMEWTLPGVKLDGRGNRRMFTIASSPTEQDIMLGVKFYEPSSEFKNQLKQLAPGDIIQASQLTGSFTMPRNKTNKLAFIARGIGITPFRSMVKSLIDSGEQRDVVLIYSVSDDREFDYIDTWREAAAYGIKVHFICTTIAPIARAGVTYGKLTAEVLNTLLPDVKDRTVYISGPNAMVDTLKHSLQSIGVSRTSIRTDHFSGY